VVHRHLKGQALLLAVGVAACGGGAPPPSTPAADLALPRAHAPALEAGPWGAFHSKRLQLTVKLPDGRAWKIDDRGGPDLVAVHPPTGSRLVIGASQEDELMNRQRCEERARARGWVPATALSTVEDEVHVGPGAYDSRVWTAIGTERRPGAALDGHVFLFGAFLRRCLFVRFSTKVPVNEEPVMASRLAIASTRIVKAITLDPPRTTDDATIPRVKPEIQR
jgi:hypothetical protein